jgi:hypothetical protein
MFEIKLMNVETGQVFSKFYESYYSWKCALNKMKYSKKLKILSYWEA